MKRFLSIIALAVMACATASAQNNLYLAVTGLYYDATGAVAIADPTTTIVVDIIVEKEQTIVGPYARYAQKYIDVRGSLVEKTTYTIKNANLAVMTCNAPLSVGELAEPTIDVQSHLHSATEFAKVSPDRLSLSPISAEEQAKIEKIRNDLGTQFCRRCNYCAPCTAGISIYSVFLMDGYLTRYGLADWARMRYNAMDKTASDCVDCGVCETRCPYNLPIRQMMKEVAAKFGK